MEGLQKRVMAEAMGISEEDVLCQGRSFFQHGLQNLFFKAENYGQCEKGLQTLVAEVQALDPSELHPE
eukprot:11323187-Karenia_brevis.AAC.1